MKYPFLAGAALALGAIAVIARPATEGLELGKPAPNITATSWFNHLGTDIDLSDFKGQAVVVEFWATW